MQIVKDKFSFLNDPLYKEVKQHVEHTCFLLAMDSFLYTLFGRMDGRHIIDGHTYYWYNEKSCLLLLYFIKELHQKGKSSEYIVYLCRSLSKRQEMFGGLENAIEIFLKMEDDGHDNI